ncbi:zinc-binding dehydrogenase [Nonomuraea sp. NPDC049480]|uniref:zinc-binding dehydrogenase n=1 Tax=Nonomuraea sp. NPDC049480 TaxID=3364353 RepID=UPI0037A8AF9E
MVRSLGADHVAGCTKEDFTRAGRRYDALIDLIGNRTLTDCRRTLMPKGTLVAAGPGDASGSGPC